METRNKKRKAAEAFSEKGEAFLKDNKKAKAHDYFLKAARTQKTIGLKFRTNDDWRKLAAYRKSIADTVNNTVNADRRKCDWYKDAIQALTKIPKAERISDDWRYFADLCFGAGTTSANNDFKLRWFKKMLNKLKNLPADEYTDEDYLRLAKGSSYLSQLPATLESKIVFIEQTISALNKISINGRDAEFWKALAVHQFAIGDFYNAKNDLPNAYLCYNAVLNGEQIPLKFIKQSYSKLISFSVTHSLSKRINDLGKQVFGDLTEPINHIERVFIAIYLELKISKSDADLMQFIRLMRLLDQYVTHKDFPNPAIAAWLSDPVKAQVFKDRLKELQEIYQPLMLTKLLESGHSVTLGLTLKIKALENELADLKKVLMEQLPQLCGSSLFRATDRKGKEKEATLIVENFARPTGP